MKTSKQGFYAQKFSLTTRSQYCLPILTGNPFQIYVQISVRIGKVIFNIEIFCEEIRHEETLLVITFLVKPIFHFLRRHFSGNARSRVTSSLLLLPLSAGFLLVSEFVVFVLPFPFSL
jgi:hypothetical protein